ncbi:MAG TPA: bifunctional phosphoglucose/phosphomannose isomerase [Candidatus Limnocylindria bacterium]|nr:bifunctional phosphoglucose/phosphomannose isomerase [Candidatus Limnocylindria bacterium]
MDARDFFGYKDPDQEPGRRDEPAGTDPDEASPPQFDEAVTLDDPAVLRRIDAADMLGRVRELPRQVALARRVAAAVRLDARHREVDRVLVTAMGGSAIGAELVAALAGDRLRVPLIIHRDYGLPAWAGERTLVLAVSHSGQTEETVSAVGAARARGLPLVVLATGGQLGSDATADDTPYLRYEAPGQPRAAIGFGIGLVHELLVRAGLLTDPDPLGPAVEALQALLDRNAPPIETSTNPAKQLAWSIFGRIPVIFGAGPMAPVARRWKTQFNENAKAWAMTEAMPEANHNAIEGSLNPRELSDAVYVIELREPDEPGRITARYAVVNELLGERATTRSVVWTEGPSPLARVLTGVAFGDLVSVYLAILYQTDPTPVTLLTMLKERLAKSTD